MKKAWATSPASGARTATRAVEKGWQIVGNIDSCGAALPITLIGDKKYCDENPEVVAKFLRVFLRAVNMLKAEGSSPEMVKEYQRFFKEWAGMEYTAEQAKQDIDYHPVWNLEEQLELFDSSKGPSQAMIWQKKIAEFFAAQGKYSEDDLKKLEAADYGCTDKFLKMVKTSDPQLQISLGETIVNRSGGGGTPPPRTPGKNLQASGSPAVEHIATRPKKSFGR